MKNDAIELDLNDLDTADEASMNVLVRGKPSGWKWHFAGPGHPQVIEANDRKARERLREEKEQLDARMNGERIEPKDESLEQLRLRNVNAIVERLLGWSPVKINGEDLPFTPENARKMLLDERKDFFRQATRFLQADASFMRPAVGV